MFLGSFGWVVVELDLCSVPDVKDGCKTIDAVGKPWFVRFLLAVEVFKFDIFNF